MKRLLTSLLIAMMALSVPFAEAKAQEEKEILVQIDTDMGKIKVKLYNDTPLHRDNFIKNVKDMTAADIMAVVKDVTNYKLTIDDYLDLMAMWFRDVLMFKSTNDTNYLIFSDEISLIKSQAEVMSYEGIQDILNSIDKVKVRLKANVNFDLCIELLIMAMKEDM